VEFENRQSGLLLVQIPGNGTKILLLHDRRHQRMVKNEKTGEQELAKGAGPSTNILLVMSGKGVKVPAVENAKFSKDFMSSKKMRPILFSHGDKSTANMLAGTMIDFASRGYACFAPLHTDVSCLYTEKKMVSRSI